MSEYAPLVGIKNVSKQVDVGIEIVLIFSDGFDRQEVDSDSISDKDA